MAVREWNNSELKVPHFAFRISHFQSVLRLPAGSAEGDDVKEEGDDERPRFARHQQQNSEAQNQGNHQINQSCQCQFH